MEIQQTPVVPHAGTWIEIQEQPQVPLRGSVVPHAGTWIEISEAAKKSVMAESFPTRERGLKYLL